MEKEKRSWDRAAQWPEEIELLKSIIIKTGLIETTKWGAPVYTYNGKNIIGIGGFKSYFGIWFFKGVFLKDKAGVLVNAQEGTTRSQRQWRFNSKAEIDEKLILEYIKEAIAIEEAGLEVKPQKKETIIPVQLQKEFESSPALFDAFNTLTSFKKREYTEYIESAKKEETKLSRLEKIKHMILQGLGINDKYR